MYLLKMYIHLLFKNKKKNERFYFTQGKLTNETKCGNQSLKIMIPILGVWQEFIIKNHMEKIKNIPKENFYILKNVRPVKMYIQYKF